MAGARVKNILAEWCKLWISSLSILVLLREHQEGSTHMSEFWKKTYCYIHVGLIDGRITQGFASEYNINSLVHCIIHCHFYVPFPSFIEMNINILCVTRCPPSLLQVSNRFRSLSGNEGATSGSFSGGGKRSVRGRVPGRPVILHLHLYPPHCPEPTGRPPRDMETVWDCLLLQAVTFFKHNSSNICAQGWG